MIVDNFQLDIKSLIDIAIGSGHVGRVNFCALRTLLNCFAIKMRMINEDIGIYLEPQECFGIKERLIGGEDEDAPPAAAEEESEKPEEVTTEADTEASKKAGEEAAKDEAAVEAAAEAPADNQADTPAEAPIDAPNKAPVEALEPSSEKEVTSATEPITGEMEETTMSETTLVEKVSDFEIAEPTSTKQEEETKADSADKLTKSEKQKAESTEAKEEEEKKAIVAAAKEESSAVKAASKPEPKKQPAPPADVVAVPPLPVEMFAELEVPPLDVEEPEPSKESSCESFVKTINAVDSDMQVDYIRFKQMFDKWEKLMVVIAILTERSLTSYRTEDQHRILSYLSSEFLGDFLHQEVPSDFTPEHKFRRSKGAYPGSLDSQRSAELEKKKKVRVSALAEDLTKLTNKVNVLTEAFVTKDFEKQFKRLESLLEDSLRINTQSEHYHTKMNHMEAMIAFLQKEQKIMNEKLEAFDKSKINIKDLLDFMETKPDFNHLKKKVSVMDFVQHKHMVNENIVEINQNLENVMQRFSILDEISDVLILLRDADWKRSLRLEFEVKIMELRKEFNELLKSKLKCETLGVPLFCNMKVTTKPKQSEDECEKKSEYYLPSSEDIEKACRGRLRTPDGKPYRLPPRNHLCKGLTKGQQVKHIPTVPKLNPKSLIAEKCLLNCNLNNCI